MGVSAPHDPLILAIVSTDHRASLMTWSPKLTVPAGLRPRVYMALVVPVCGLEHLRVVVVQIVRCSPSVRKHGGEKRRDVLPPVAHHEEHRAGGVCDCVGEPYVPGMTW